jgi:small subunit ribosomal protein S27Ae
MAEKAKEKGKQTEKLPEKPLEKPAPEKPAEKPEEKGKKPQKVKKKEKRAYTRYKIDEKGLTRLRPFCERCGPGFFMADHGDRYACGHCGFTRYKRA